VGEHSGAVTVYRVPRHRRLEVLLGSDGTLALWGISLLGIVVGRFVFIVSMAGAVAVGALIVMLWAAVWTARLTVRRVQITDRYHWQRAERAGSTVIRQLPVTGLLPAAEVRAVVRDELSEILDLLVEQDRLRVVRRDARRAAGDLPAGESARHELDAELAELDERLGGLTAQVEARVARLTGLAAQATDLATIEARRRRARQATARIRDELDRPDPRTAGHQPIAPAGEAVERAGAILAAYRELADDDARADDQSPP
jgi:hypothetical protein